MILLLLLLRIFSPLDSSCSSFRRRRRRRRTFWVGNQKFAMAVNASSPFFILNNSAATCVTKSYTVEETKIVFRKNDLFLL